MIDYGQMFDNKQFPKSIGQFKIASTLALVGHTFLYGKVTPYIGVLELDEHVIFKVTNRLFHKVGRKIIIKKTNESDLLNNAPPPLSRKGGNC